WWRTTSPVRSSAPPPAAPSTPDSSGGSAGLGSTTASYQLGVSLWKTKTTYRRPLKFWRAWAASMGSVTQRERVRWVWSTRRPLTMDTSSRWVTPNSSSKGTPALPASEMSRVLGRNSRLCTNTSRWSNSSLAAISCRSHWQPACLRGRLLKRRSASRLGSITVTHHPKDLLTNEALTTKRWKKLPNSEPPDGCWGLNRHATVTVLIL